MQMACILNMAQSWKKNTKLRIFLLTNEAEDQAPKELQVSSNNSFRIYMLLNFNSELKGTQPIFFPVFLCLQAYYLQIFPVRVM